MEEDQKVVDVDLAHLSESMSLELNKLGTQSNENEIENFTIFPVPYEFRQSKKNLFDPSVVSIGPLHHGKESLKAMQDQKWRFLRDFLFRGNHISLDLCLSEIKLLEQRARRCYSERVDFGSNDFIEMMLLDGCFVLEYFLKWYEYLFVDFPLWVLTRIFPKRNSLSLSFPNSTHKSLMVIPCATELQNAGIQLRRKSKLYCMLDISFDHRVLKIPRLTITNESKTILANIIAFEQYKSDHKTSASLSSFALFLDSLVNTPEDLMLLQQCGIINNHLDSEEELTNFFNQICKGMVVENDHFFAELFVEVNKYCESSWSKRRARWNRHKKQFIKDYFSSPWTAISLVAGVFVVLLTFVQAFFAVYAYYVPPS
ncbi:UPF0481 protein At3g47200-like [Carex rostrata]